MSASPVRAVSLASGESPERTLLVACARLRLPADEAERIRRLPSRKMDWDAVIALARRNRLLAFLHRHLRQISIPPGPAVKVGQMHRMEVARALRLTAELRRMMDGLSAAGIEALAYKGPVLAVQAYGDLAMRAFSDLDLLVRPADVPRALALLEADGYEPVMRFTPARERWFRRVDGDYQMLDGERGVLVEVHARVQTLRFGIAFDTDGLMRRAVPVSAGGAMLRTLADDDLLLVLCAHGAKHRWKRLEWVAALAELLRAGRGDLGTILARATDLHGRRTVLLGLHLAHDLLGAPLPGGVIGEIEGDPRLSRLAAEAVARMFEPDGGEDDEDAGEAAAANLRFNLRLGDGAMDRARFAARWIFGPTPEDWRAVDLPDALFPLYRIVRPVRLLIRHGHPRRAP
jgi:hypothetical protein